MVVVGRKEGGKEGRMKGRREGRKSCITSGCGLSVTGVYLPHPYSYRKLDLW